MVKKTWTEKLNIEKTCVVKTIEKRFADIMEGESMLITSPQIINEYVKEIPKGTSTDLKTMRNDLAILYHAEKTCPVTTGIFLRVVAEAAFEQHQKGKPIEDITPFWRMIDSKSKIAKKLTCGVDFITKQRIKEGLAP